MRSRSFDDEVVSGLALLVLLAAAVAGLHWLGIDTGIPRWVACTIGHSLVSQVGPGLVQLVLVIGVVLAMLPWTRPTGVGMILTAVAGMAALATWLEAAPGYCGFTSGGGFTP